MAQLLVKIELQGKPDQEAYVLLDRFMSSQFWEKVRGPGSRSEAANPMYRASTFGDRPNLASMANDLKSNIEYKVWEKARVLMVQSQNWIEVA